MAQSGLQEEIIRKDAALKKLQEEVGAKERALKVCCISISFLVGTLSSYLARFSFDNRLSGNHVVQHHTKAG